MYVSLTVTAGEGPGSRAVTINVGDTPDMAQTLHMLVAMVPVLTAGLSQPLPPEQLKKLADSLAAGRSELAGAMGRVPPAANPPAGPTPPPVKKGADHGEPRGG